MSSKHIILASGSAGRKAMLENAGVNFTVAPADINEKAVVKSMADQPVTDITSELAQQKALHVSRANPDVLVIGSDQTLEFDGQLISKAKDADDALKKLKSLRGQKHSLNSAVCVALNGAPVFSHIAQAHLTMHDLSDDFLERYIAADTDALTSCVGAYKIEGAGAWLFSQIQGDVFTIMGMPLLPLLAFLRDEYQGHP